MRRQATAITLARLAMAGFCLVAATYVLTFVPVPRLAAHGSGLWAEMWAVRLRLLALGVPTLVGVSAGLWAERRFRRGYLDDNWSEADLARVRKFLASPAWRWAAVFLAVGAILGLAAPLRGHHYPVLWYVLLVPTQALQRLRQMVNPPAVKNSGLTDWANIQPIRSDHWGERSV